MKFGGQIRVRSEWRDPADYRLPGTFGRGSVSHETEDAHVVWLRSRLWFDAQVLEQVRAYVKFQDSRKGGEERALDAVSDLGGRHGLVLLDDDGEVLIGDAAGSSGMFSESQRGSGAARSPSR